MLKRTAGGVAGLQLGTAGQADFDSVLKLVRNP